MTTTDNGNSRTSENSSAGEARPLPAQAAFLTAPVVSTHRTAGRHRRWPWIIVAIIVLMAAALSWVLFNGRDGASPPTHRASLPSTAAGLTLAAPGKVPGGDQLLKTMQKALGTASAKTGVYSSPDGSQVVIAAAVSELSGPDVPALLSSVAASGIETRGADTCATVDSVPVCLRISDGEAVFTADRSDAATTERANAVLTGILNPASGS